MSMRTTTELLDAQARQAQEMELKRMYTELSSLQIERDDAVLRYEQLSTNLRREHDMQQQESRRERQALQRRLDELRVRCDKLEASKYDVESQTVPLRERLAKAQAEAERTRVETTALQQTLDDTRRKLGDAEMAAAALREELQTSVATERGRADLLEQRVQEVLRDLQDAKDRALAEAQQAVRDRELLQRQYSAAVQNIQAAQNALHRSEREVVSLQAQLERLGEALRLHKQQIKSNDEGVLGLQRELEQARLRERTHLLAVEQLKVDNARLLRAQGRMAELSSARVF
ncbi:hypothetical protein STCU_09717 [Strigomonas culicis]|nr:hypothetical protein STCU_09717 [Strigomonas culicis]|eukprot:EPY18901.1 hypothetical protein STCU_09717 [Strigomonas culicis]